MDIKDRFLSKRSRVSFITNLKCVCFSTYEPRKVFEAPAAQDLCEILLWLTPDDFTRQAESSCFERVNVHILRLKFRNVGPFPCPSFNSFPSGVKEMLSYNSIANALKQNK